jgi:quercetin dioxygenase-like cupin family protein
MLKVEDIQPKSAPAFLRDPYSEWASREGVPVIEDFGVDLMAVEGKRWPRFGVDGAIVHLKGRGDFISVFMLEIRAGGKTVPQRHLYEQVIYVLAGQGSTTIEVAPGQTSSFEWGPGSLFAIPLNVRYQHFNGSGAEPVRLSVTNNLCIMMKLFGNDQFIFDNGFAFPAEALKQHPFSGEGDYIPGPRGRLMWETNFVPDLHSAELLSDDKRGKSSANQIFILADCKMHAHCSLMPVGTYKNAHRHGADGDKEFVRVDWRPGCMFAPPDQMFHQHFNTSPQPARYMATALGNSRYPFTEKNRQGKLGVDVSVKEGGLQIEFEDQDPRIHKMYLEALAKNGVACTMTWVPQTVGA